MSWPASLPTFVDHTVVPASDLIKLSDALESAGDPTSYEPTVTATASPTATAFYSLVGKWLTVEFDIVMTAALTGNPTLSLPSGMKFAIVQARGIGTAILFDTSASLTRLATVSVSNESAVSMSYEQSNVRIGLSATGPWTWAAGDSIRGLFTARIA